MAYTTCTVPQGAKITIQNGKLQVPDQPIIPFIRGDGTGPDIWASSVRVLDAAVAKAYGGKRSMAWMEVFAGEESFKRFNNWLPDDTVNAFREFLVGIKGPLTTPVGGGIRSLNVALRQLLDLYVCLRPVQYFTGVPSPVKRPEKVDMVIFRENTEDIYAGIEFAGGSPEAQKVLDFLAREFPKDFSKIRFGTQAAIADYMKLAAPDHDASHVPVQVGIGIKPVSNVGTIRLSMVGTLERDGVSWTLIGDPQGGVHRVKVGNFLGRHHGKIVEMTETYVAVVEIVSDGTKDGWVERPRTIKLSGV